MILNENDPFAADWLRALVAAGELPAGVVDGRDIREVTGDDLRRHAECHLFAGIGGWPLALRLAGWPAGREVWTGSCPCQPFSPAGKRKKEKDPRHLWPELRRLIAECRPATIFGEQVAGKDGLHWLAGVRSDLEALGYVVGAADLCSPWAGEEGEGWVDRGGAFAWEPIVIGAPHIRQRLYWVADAGSERRDGVDLCLRRAGKEGWDATDHTETAGRGEARGLANLQEQRRGQGSSVQGRGGYADGGNARRLADPDGRLPGDGGLQPGGEHGQQPADGGVGGVGDTNGQHPRSSATVDAQEASWGRATEPGPTSGVGFWSDFDILPCTDGKARRVEPGSQPLASGIPARMGRLRGYGNAIVPQVAAAFVRAFLETEPDASRYAGRVHAAGRSAWAEAPAPTDRS